VRAYKVCETPHFKIHYIPPAEPLDVAELAERLWIDTAFFHAAFADKWRDRKMAIVLTNDQAAFEGALRWTEAGGIDRVGPQGPAGVVTLTPAGAEAIDIFTHVRVLPGCTAGQAGRKPQPVKGMAVPLYANALAADLLSIHAGPLREFASEGRLAVFSGNAWHREILLTGRCETKLAQARGTGRDAVATGGFPPDKKWAAELKKMIKTGGVMWKPRLDALMQVKEHDAVTSDIVFAWSFAWFLQSTPQRCLAFNKVCGQIDEKDFVPDLDEMAKLYGYPDTAAMEKAWIEWMDSPAFR
jgi:hypothetical protein